MNLKSLFSLLIFLVNYYITSGQEIKCDYKDISRGYTCDMFIYNLNGLNNFTEITGTHLDGFNDDDVREVDTFYTSQTTNVPAIICETFQQVTFIDLAHGIEYIDENSFKLCKNLQNLILRYNKISTIDVNAFINNVNLQELDLADNKLTTLPENVFINQHNLNSLTLADNEIFDLPENIFNPLVNLGGLRMEANQIKVLKHQWFKNLINLSGLHLTRNPIEELPKNIFSPLKNLKHLRCFGNRLTVIHSDSLGLLPNLTWVDFSSNQIDAMDEKIIDNIGIGTLVFYNNACANTEVRFDFSESRETLRSRFRKCFNNYIDLYPEPISKALVEDVY
ncbi:unnamed protein product [Chironomus riparius]|uniref:Uncharacterized protein n=1 Tax=Chironomus riparius TaxID=315576 RepID=A0A9N9RKB6_9DIPT|nr:unnamed protein product [Chironomus riparius]